MWSPLYSILIFLRPCFSFIDFLRVCLHFVHSFPSFFPSVFTFFSAQYKVVFFSLVWLVGNTNIVCNITEHKKAAQERLLSSDTQAHTYSHTLSLICVVVKWKEGAGRKDSQLLHLSSGVHRGNSLAAEHPDYQTQLPIISCLVCELRSLSI